MTMKAPKGLLLAAGMALVCLAGTAGSLAWMSQSTAAENVVTLGRLGLTLDEPGWQEGQQLIEGSQIAKDPVLTVAQGSAACYVFATIEMTHPALFEAADIELQYQDGDGQWQSGVDPRWQLLETQALEGGGTRQVYAYERIVTAQATQYQELPLPLFGRIRVGEGAAGREYAAAAQNSITVQGWAIQADGFSDAGAAWAALEEETA